jgi:hypothetical protein
MKSALSKLPTLSIVLILIAFVTGCVGPKVATDLLGNVQRNQTPLVDYIASLEVGINPAINNYEKLDQTVKESLELALKNANIFGLDSSSQYKVTAHISIASQAAMSFGNFDGKLQIDYLVLDHESNEILNETIYTEAGSDTWYFSGAKRHRRARAVNISKNVLQFVEILQQKLKS